MGLLRLRSVFGLCAIFVFVILAHDIEHRSGVFRFAVYNSLSGPLAVIRVPLVLVPAYECVERTSQKTCPANSE